MADETQARQVGAEEPGIASGQRIRHTGETPPQQIRTLIARRERYRRLRWRCKDTRTGTPEV